MHAASAQHPASFPRRILMLVTGMTPQVLTETLWALATHQVPKFVPTEIRVLTTSQGRNTLIESLLTEAHPIFARLCEEWQLGPILFGPDQIEVLQTREGSLMQDLLTPADNEAAADHICRWVQNAAQEKDAALHVSIAGGRKTMGYFVGYALSLFGRLQDRLSHVLVSEPYERLNGPEGFFYPSREPRQVFNMSKTLSADAQQARVYLAHIPFVRIGLGMHEDILAHGHSFSAVVASAERHLAPPSITLDFSSCSITCSDNPPIRLEPLHFAFYAWLAIRRKTLGEDAGVSWSETPDPMFNDYLFIYGQSRGEISWRDASDAFKSEHRTITQDGFCKQRWEQSISKLRTTLEKKLGKTAAQAYLIGELGNKQGRRQQRGLKIAPEHIQFINRPETSRETLLGPLKP